MNRWNRFSLGRRLVFACAVLSAAALASQPSIALAASASSQLSVLDPYLLAIASDGAISAQTAIAALGSAKAAAAGLASDGASAAIAVFKSSSSAKVTFTATNGATLAAYNTGFLNSVTPSSAASLTVTPVASGGAYYALALVVAGAPPVVKTGSPIAVAAQSAGVANKQTATLTAIPIPVVLVHGLWGDKSSLSHTESYLKKINATYKANSFLVAPICYSTYLAFDAATDTLPKHGAGCEVTSAQSLDAYFSSLYASLDGKHWVGGRADAVVHSMGGLVVRHYAATARFKSVRNRRLGAFRNVVTLDTPETGSALATWLDNNPNRTRKTSDIFSNAYLLWTTACGFSSSTTLAQCFDSNGMPLAYSGQPLSSGAVASLIPGSTHIAGAPAATVYNTSHGKWYAAAADYKASDSPHALLRDTLDTLVAATYSSGQTPATVDSMLGSADNDVIVTLSSQTSTAVAAQTRQYKDLQHTAAPTEAELLFAGDGNTAVDASSTVDGQVAYWLGLQASATPQAEFASGAEETTAEFAPSLPEPQIRPSHLAPGRMKIEPPAGSLALGRPATLALVWAGAPAARIVVELRDPQGRLLRNLQSGSPVGSGPARVLEELGATTTIEVTPLKAGAVTLTVLALFPDGGLEFERLPLRVEPAAEGLDRLELNSGFDRLALIAGAEAAESQAQLAPRLWYAGLDAPLFLSSLDGLKVTVAQPEADPVVRVDANGVVHALRPGRAVIEASLGAAHSAVTVEVYDRETASAGYARATE